MSFEILNNYSDVKYYKVTDEELSALKHGAELMELAREFFNAGPGNQRSCHIGSNGEAYIRWRKARALKKLPLNQAAKDYVKFFERQISPNCTKPAEDAVTDLVVGFEAAYFVKGGNCAENADMMAFLVIANNGLTEQYRRLHRLWLARAGHEITILETTNRSGRPILLDPWIPASQACLLEHSRWRVALKKYKPDWSIDIANENKFCTPFVKGLMKYSETEGETIINNDPMVQRLKKDGEGAYVQRQCRACGKKWRKDLLVKDKKGVKKLCPNCKKSKLYSISNTEYYKPPYHKNIEAKMNLNIHLYHNIGVIHEDIAHDEKGRAVIPYTLNERPAEADINYWKTHHKRMRTYRWGQVE
jgi:predicted nucleic-acid-binding Zn-ribbon protein